MRVGQHTRQDGGLALHCILRTVTLYWRDWLCEWNTEQFGFVESSESPTRPASKDDTVKFLLNVLNGPVFQK